MIRKFLVPKIGVGNEVYGEKYTKEILIGYFKEKRIPLEEGDTSSMYPEDNDEYYIEKIMFINGIEKGELYYIQREYLLFDTIDEAILKKKELILRIKEDMIEITTKKISKMISKDIEEIESMSNQTFLEI